jgi:hypothetical protein
LKLPVILEGLPKGAPILLIPVIVFLAAVGLTLGMSSDGNDNDSLTVTVPTVAVQVSNQGPAPTPQPTAIPVAAARTDCAAIRGTDYRSPEERLWFQQNCGTTAQTSPTTSSAPVTAAAPAAPAASTYGVESPTGQKLVISKAGINTDIYTTKMTTGGPMPAPVGYFYALTYEMSAIGLGGDVNSGNLVLSGHVDCGRCYNGGSGTAIFWHARYLVPGDTAQVYTTDGRVVTYVVTSSAAYSASATDFTPFVAPGAADMTIITCTGTFGGSEYDQRHVVQFVKQV